MSKYCFNSIDKALETTEENVELRKMLTRELNETIDSLHNCEITNDELCNCLKIKITHQIFTLRHCLHIMEEYIMEIKEMYEHVVVNDKHLFCKYDRYFYKQREFMKKVEKSLVDIEKSLVDISDLTIL